MALDEITLWDSLDNLKDPELEQCTIHTTEDALQALQDTERYIVSRFFDKLVRLSGNDIAEIQPIVDKLGNLKDWEILSGEDWLKLLKLLQHPDSARFAEKFMHRYAENLFGPMQTKKVMNITTNWFERVNKLDHIFFEGDQFVWLDKIIKYVIDNTEKVDYHYVNGNLVNQISDLKGTMDQSTYHTILMQTMEISDLLRGKVWDCIIPQSAIQIKKLDGWDYHLFIADYALPHQAQVSHIDNDMIIKNPNKYINPKSGDVLDTVGKLIGVKFSWFENISEVQQDKRIDVHSAVRLMNSNSHTQNDKFIASILARILRFNVGMPLWLHPDKEWNLQLIYMNCNKQGYSSGEPIYDYSIGESTGFWTLVEWYEGPIPTHQIGLSLPDDIV